MATLQGISALSMGDGNGGKAALSISTYVLNILSNDKLSYMTATMNPGSNVKAGTVSYYVPEVKASGDYGQAGEGVAFSDINTGLVSVNVNIPRINKWEVETFDIARLNESDYIIGVVAAGIAKAIQADLNAHYLSFLVKQFKAGGDLQAQVIELDNVGKGLPTLTPEQSRVDYNKLQIEIAKLQKIFNKSNLGVNINEVFGVLSVEADIDIRNAFWNQPNTLGEFIIKETLEGTKLGNLKYFVDVMLNNQIDANTSFSNKELNTKGLVGFVAHKEAIAMPLNVNQTTQTINPENGNIRFITKYQFGIGILRKNLIFAIKNKNVDLPRIKNKE